MKGYSVVNLKNEDGSYTQGFRKIKSALDNWENRKREVEESAENALVKLLNDTKEPNWFEKKILGYKSKMDKVRGVKCWELLDNLRNGGYITKDESDSLDFSLKFIRGETYYLKLRAIIKNGEQFMLDDQLCSFVNSYSTYKPKGDK